MNGYKQERGRVDDMTDITILFYTRHRHFRVYIELSIPKLFEKEV